MMKKDPSIFQLIAGVFGGVALFSIWMFAVAKYDGLIEMGMAGMITGAGTFFLHDACFPSGKIFGLWIPWVERNFRDNPKNPFSFLANPMGLCAYCQNIWIGIMTFIIMDIPLDMNWWFLLPSLFVAHISLTVLDKLFWT